MKQTRVKITIFTLALMLIVTVAALFGINFKAANAAGTVTVSGTNVFTSTENANVYAYRQKDAGGSPDKYYTMFSLTQDEDNISFRRNLAYHWFYGEKDDDGVVTPAEGLFNMQIGFVSTDFEKFVITFESQQYNKTKDAKSVNYIMFFPYSETTVSAVKVLITDNKDATADDADNTAILAESISIVFGVQTAEGYSVIVSSGEESVSGEFKNVGGNYAKSSTSTTSPVYPLIFSATFKDGKVAEGQKGAQMVLYSLNGQSFEVSDTHYNADKDYYYGGTVTDNTPPVLCMEEELTHFNLGGKVDFKYKVIDVLRSSPSDTVYYYILTVDQYKEKTDFTASDLFEKVKTDTVLESDKEKYLPTADEALGLGEKFETDMAVKVYVNIKDTTANGEEDNVYLDWYVKSTYLLDIKGSRFIAVGEDKLGAAYKYVNLPEMEKGDEWKALVAQYQAEVDKAAKNLSAGSSSYFYLPSPEKLFSDNATAYTDMKISIYFYHDSQSSNTSLATNNLSINITKPGSYTFTVYATDANGNSMYYLEQEGEGDEATLKPVEFSSSKVWEMFDDKNDKGLYYKLPWFTFDVGYTGVSFKENAGKQSTAFVGTSYSSASFDVNGISGTYDIKYRLFVFDRAGYARANNGETLSYDKFIELKDQLYSDTATHGYFTEIVEVKESDSDYEKFKDYGWKSTSTTFTPQEGNTFYYIRAEVTDKQFNSDPVTSSLAVLSSINSKTIKGENQWLKNNVASVVLFAITGVLIVAIILLIIIKPKNSEDIDVQFEKDKKKDKKSSK